MLTRVRGGQVDQAHELSLVLERPANDTGAAVLAHLVKVVQLEVVVLAGEALAALANTLVADRARHRVLAAHLYAVGGGPEPVGLVGDLVVGVLNIHGQVGHDVEPNTIGCMHRVVLDVRREHNVTRHAREHTKPVLCRLGAVRGEHHLELRLRDDRQRRVQSRDCQLVQQGDAVAVHMDRAVTDNNVPDVESCITTHSYVVGGQNLIHLVLLGPGPDLTLRGRGLARLDPRDGEVLGKGFAPVGAAGLVPHKRHVAVPVRGTRGQIGTQRLDGVPVRQVLPAADVDGLPYRGAVCDLHVHNVLANRVPPRRGVPVEVDHDGLHAVEHGNGG